MKIKIMYPNNKGKIELSKEELEKLLNEAYNEGYSDGHHYYGYAGSISTTTPYYYGGTVTGLNSTKPSYDSIEICGNVSNITANSVLTSTAEEVNINTTEAEKELAWVYTGNNDKLTMVKTNEI
jgi:hypothetical protein